MLNQGLLNVLTGLQIHYVFNVFKEEKLFHESSLKSVKKGKIRGEVSQGMICAEDEIGLGESHDGIMVLDEKASIGMEASQYFVAQRYSINPGSFSE